MDWSDLLIAVCLVVVRVFDITDTETVNPCYYFTGIQLLQ